MQKQQFAATAFVLSALLAFASVAAAWTGPTATPPGNNTPAPLNVSNAGQEKVGGLLLNTGGTAASSGLIVSNGRVGIGVASPTQKLDVAGTIKMTGFKLGISATAGHVLTADASGVGTWQAASGGGGGGSGAGFSMRVFDSANTPTGSGTWTKPAGVRTIKVTVIGGGGSAQSDASGSGRQSGGGGGICVKVIDVTAIDTIPVTVGLTNTALNSDGKTSSFGGCTSTGGKRGQVGVGASSGGIPGFGSGGDLNGYGGLGDEEYDTHSSGGGGGAGFFGYGKGGNFNALNDGAAIVNVHSKGTGGAVIVEEYR